MEDCQQAIRERKEKMHFFNNISLMSGVFSVGGRLSLMVMRKTVMERRAEMPRVTFSPDSEGT